MLFLGLSSCTLSAPLKEFALASEAIEMSKKHQGSTYAAEYHEQAIQAYKQAQKFIKERYYQAAQDALGLAQSFAEKSEEVSRIKQKKEDLE